MKLEAINNYKYKAYWNNIIYFKYTIDYFDVHHVLFGLFGIFIFVCWQGARRKR